MLVLSRKLGEKIVIDTDITITVVEVQGNRVKLGIQAPANVRVLRQELLAALAEPTTTPNLQPALG